ncbi:MAG: GMP synthase [Halofilum sp. (in: g-proteobacteria)]|nr:GMP synthase [Halofilum sp. (in: g-proteobacteria)]
MRIGILQCDSVRPELQPRFGDYPDMFMSLLTTERVQPEFRVYDLTRDRFPASLDECDAWLVTGSKWCVNDGEPWIERAHELVMELHRQKRPLIGICFGHQMVARALGGRVERAAVGWGAGLHTANIHEQRPWMQPARETLSLLVSHQDQVTEAPAELQRLAGHDFCPYDMFQLGDHILTLQGHPEFEVEYSRTLIELRRDQIGAEQAQAALDSLARAPDRAVAAEWIHRFIEHAMAATPGPADTMRGSERPKEDAE